MNKYKWVDEPNGTLNNLTMRVQKLEKANLKIPDHNTEAGDEFVRKELISAWEGAEDRDQVMLEYVIRIFSDAEQWAEFYDSAELEHVHSIGREM